MGFQHYHNGTQWDKAYVSWKMHFWFLKTTINIQNNEKKTSYRYLYPVNDVLYSLQVFSEVTFFSSEKIFWQEYSFFWKALMWCQVWDEVLRRNEIIYLVAKLLLILLLSSNTTWMNINFWPFHIFLKRTFFLKGCKFSWSQGLYIKRMEKKLVEEFNLRFIIQIH